MGFNITIKVYVWDACRAGIGLDADGNQRSKFLMVLHEAPQLLDLWFISWSLNKGLCKLDCNDCSSRSHVIQSYNKICMHCYLNVHIY